MIDDYTLRIEFEEPNIDFANTMASSLERNRSSAEACWTLPFGRFTDLVGSGPFVPAEHNRNGVSDRRSATPITTRTGFRFWTLCPST